MFVALSRCHFAPVRPVVVGPRALTLWFIGRCPVCGSLVGCGRELFGPFAPRWGALLAPRLAAELEGLS